MTITARQVNGANRYSADWKSLDARPIPAWFDDAKFGIFIHWGIYSVPSWSPRRSEVNSTGEAYAEWYGMQMLRPETRFYKHHREVYGPNFEYADFAPMFKAELFDPAHWASLFRKSGARYVVLTSKHHDGFCLWPSAYAPNWNSVDIGPHRNLVQQVKDAVEAVGLRMGLYYSISEWFHPFEDERIDPSSRRTETFVSDHMIPQIKELIETFEPKLLFTDGEWTHSSEEWRSKEILQWIFNESRCRDEIVVNDRWGSDTRSKHGGYFTTEYGEVGTGQELASSHKWEENRGLGNSFGYSRTEEVSDYLSERALIHLLIDTVSKGGNLCLNVGPTADGRIPVLQQERLLQMGEWLDVNGEGIYNTQPYDQSGFSDRALMTTSNAAIYTFFTTWPKGLVTVNIPFRKHGSHRATILGLDQELAIEENNGRLAVQVPRIAIDEAPCRCAYVLKVTED